MIASWNAPLPAGGFAEELLIRFDKGRARRMLVLPAWFDEANKLRRFTIEVMRRLDKAGIDTFLPDLPGCNESLLPLDTQTLAGWRAAAAAAAQAVDAAEVLTIRAGALIAPDSLQGWCYAPQSGPKAVRAMMRARMIAAREAGLNETAQSLLAHGRDHGLMLGGWMIGAEMLRALETAELAPPAHHREIAQSAVGGAGLWLRAEPTENAEQTAALAAIIAQAGTAPQETA
ncbi:MAG: hypothetical protein ACXIT4_08860 [Erythrobacter sp.]